ncbi:MAG: type II toxin-antitoxin system VapC family toxin [Planctomycetia bacterium]|nr:type II toxin-antitoxin system VapC family toxin [Planctomycetia bacterium]
MRLLLDTHSFLWFILNDARLSAKAAALIADANNEVNVSPASYWEIAIKISLGKYSAPGASDDFIEKQIAANDFRIQHIEPRHAAALAKLPFHHKDPFDRLIVAQAIVEQLPVVSGDKEFDKYPVARLW